MPLEPGQKLDQYVLVEKIGEGGMGVVWKAHDTSLDRDVAIKVLPEDLTADSERLARFEREAKAVAALSHPNIVAIYGFGTSAGVTYAAIELLQGRTLREHLAEGHPPPRKAIEIARQVAAGLDAAHTRGVVHRDLKPDNVFLTSEGRPKILDFGLATAAAVDGPAASAIETRADLTRPGVVMGTVAYMSPEQARGERAGAPSDLFALGVMLHEMLSGAPPFRRDTAAETMTAILREDPPDLTLGKRPVGPALARVVRRCLEKAPDERFQSARDLAFALENSTVDSAMGVTPTAAEAPPLARAPRRLWLVAILATAAAFAAGWLLRPEPPGSEPPRVTQLTFSGSDLQPVVSPDGKLIAFTSSRQGVSRIWLRQVVGGGEQPLTDGQDWRPRFAPDGASVAFIRNDGETYSAYRVPVVGGRPRKIVEDVTEVEWSPDGTRLAFLRQWMENREGPSGSGLWIFDPESGEETLLLQVEAWDLLGLSWSPDGKRIATTKSSQQAGAGNWRLVVAALEGGDAEEIAFANGALVSAPTWAGPRALLYAKSSTTVSSSPSPDPILRYDLVTRREETLFWHANLFPLRLSLTESTRLSLLGDDRLVFDAHAQTQTLHEYDRSTGTLRTLVRGVSIDRQPTYSPDGTKLLFTSTRTGNVDLFAYDIEAGRLDQLTDHPASDWDGAYTPDGKSILWSSDRGGNLEIWMADADGSNPRQVSRDGVDAENPTMTADGEWIAYTSGNPDHQGIFKIRPDGADATHLVPGNWANPDVSPDGRYAIYLVTDGGLLRNEVRVLEMATGRDTGFAIEIHYDPQAPNITYGRGRWLPDGSAIAYVGVDDAGRPTVWIQDFAPGRDTSASRRPLVASRPDLVVESFGISPDGSRFALSTIRQMSSLQLADGLPKLR